MRTQDIVAGPLRSFVTCVPGKLVFPTWPLICIETCRKKQVS